MLDEVKAAGVVDAVIAAFPGEKQNPEPMEIETVLRPFAPVTRETEDRIQRLCTERGVPSRVRSLLGPWFEANDVAGGEGERVKRRIDYLMLDTCTCVLDHLPIAIAEAQNRGKTVDSRVLGLLDHEYLKKND